MAVQLLVVQLLVAAGSLSCVLAALGLGLRGAGRCLGKYQAGLMAILNLVSWYILELIGGGTHRPTATRAGGIRGTFHCLMGLLFAW